jgi:hypothetical protein
MGKNWGTLQRHWTENWEKIFPERKLRGLSPNVYIHICMWAITVGLRIWLQEKKVDRSWQYINRLQIYECRNKLELRPRSFFSWNTLIKFSMKCRYKHKIEQYSVYCILPSTSIATNWNRKQKRRRSVFSVRSSLASWGRDQKISRGIKKYPL